jgi:hypothetical protein
MPEWQGAGRYLGCEDYASMIQQMVEVRDDLLLIRKSNGGVGIMAAPATRDTEPAAARRLSAGAAHATRAQG